MVDGYVQPAGDTAYSSVLRAATRMALVSANHVRAVVRRYLQPRGPITVVDDPDTTTVRAVRHTRDDVQRHVLVLSRRNDTGPVCWTVLVVEDCSVVRCAERRAVDPTESDPWPRELVTILVSGHGPRVVVTTIESLCNTVMAVWTQRPGILYADARLPWPAARDANETMDIDALNKAAIAYLSPIPQYDPVVPTVRLIALMALNRAGIDPTRVFFPWEHEHRLRRHHANIPLTFKVFTCRSCKYQCACGDRYMLSKSDISTHIPPGKTDKDDVVGVAFEHVQRLVARRQVFLRRGIAYTRNSVLETSAHDRDREQQLQDWDFACWYLEMLTAAACIVVDDWSLPPREVAHQLLDIIPAVPPSIARMFDTSSVDASAGPRLSSISRVQDLPFRPNCIQTLLHKAETTGLKDDVRGFAASFTYLVFEHPAVAIRALPAPPTVATTVTESRQRQMLAALNGKWRARLCTCKRAREIAFPGELDCSGCTAPRDHQSPATWTLMYNTAAVEAGVADVIDMTVDDDDDDL